MLCALHLPSSSESRLQDNNIRHKAIASESKTFPPSQPLVPTLLPFSLDSDDHISVNGAVVTTFSFLFLTFFYTSGTTLLNLIFNMAIGGIY
jgi:hypothetical protein